MWKQVQSKLGNPEQPPLQNIWQVSCYPSHRLSYYICEWASQRRIRADKLTPTPSDTGETEAQNGCMTHPRSLNIGFQCLSFHPTLHTSLSCNMIYPPLRMGFPDGINGKESACQQRCKRHGFDPWVEKIPWRKKWQPTPVFLPEKVHGHRSLEGYSPWECRVAHDWSTHATFALREKLK